MIRAGLTVLSVLVLGGCFVHEPAPAPPDLPARVRVHLTDEAALRVATILGEPRREVDGRLLSAGDSLRLSVLTDREVSEFAGAREFRTELAFPRGQVTGISLRRLSWPRTLLMGALGAGALAFLVQEVTAGGGGGDGSDGDGGSGRQPSIILRIPVGSR